MNATPKQIEFATALVNEIAPLVGDDTGRQAGAATLQSMWGTAVNDRKVMSGYIDTLLKFKREWAPARGTNTGFTATTNEPAEGVYFVDGAYVKVVTAVHGSGRLYAKTWSGTEWVYSGRKPFARLTEETKVTAEQAAEFGALYGTCVFCARTLTDERSITVGYGPTCADNNSLPWGEVAAA